MVLADLGDLGEVLEDIPPSGLVIHADTHKGGKKPWRAVIGEQRDVTTTRQVVISALALDDHDLGNM